MKVYLHALGCRLNQSEIERMAARFAAAGHDLVHDSAHADLCVVNSCAVTIEAARKSRQLVRHLHRANPEAAITVTGCFAELAPEAAARLPGVTHVVPNDAKDNIAPAQSKAAPLPPGTHGRTRAFVKVQDGCNNRCAFCVTTIARGPSRSKAPDDIIAEINALVEAGYQEAVLSGVHLGAYGRDRDRHDDLGTLLRAVLRQTAIPRLRLSSLEPWDVPAGLFALWEDPRLCRHLHLPLQSGSAATLRRMARHTTPDDFAALVADARAHIPGLSITTDIIVGFPGETEAEFDESLAFVRAMDFAGLHIFRYSPRPGTKAASMPGRVNGQIQRARSAAMQALSDAGAARFMARALGQTMPVLWERAVRGSDGRFLNRGLTDTYLRVWLRSARVLTNMIVPVRLVAISDEGLQGALPHFRSD